MTKQQQIYSAIACYREGAYDLSGLLAQLEAIDPEMTVTEMIIHLDKYFEDGGE